MNHPWDIMVSEICIHLRTALPTTLEALENSMETWHRHPMETTSLGHDNVATELHPLTSLLA